MGQYRRELREQEAKLAKKERRKIMIGAACVVAAGGGIIGVAVYQNHQDLYGTYCKVGEHELSRLEYEFFYNSTINNFLSTYGAYASYFGLDTSSDLSTQIYDEETGETWEQYFQESALELMKEVFVLFDAANEAGYVLPDSSYDDFYSDISKYAKEYGLTESEYLTQLYGSNATKKNLENILKKYLTAAEYATKLQEEDLVPSDEEIEAYYEENKNSYDKVTYRVFAISADPGALTASENNDDSSDSLLEGTIDENGNIVDENGNILEIPSDETTSTDYTDEQWEEAMNVAKDKAQEFFDQVYDEETFKELCVKYSDEDYKQAYEEADASLVENATSSEMDAAIVEWLMDESREKDATAIIEDADNHMYFIVYFIDRIRDDSPTVDVRHILITPDEVEALGDDATEEEKAAYEEQVAAADDAAKAKAESLLESWKNGDATEESFGALADENSADYPEGGLYQAVCPGDMVDEFNDWIFDEARKPGDTDIVKTTYGYHIMYFVGNNDPEWKVDVKNTIINNNYYKFVSERIDSYKFEDIKGKLPFLIEDAVETEAPEDSESEETPDNTTVSSEESTESEENTEN